MEILERPDLTIARERLKLACAYSRAHSKLTAFALDKYGDNGPQISGVIRDHFPEKIKDRLRFLARNVTAASELAWVARPKRVRHTTMLMLSRAVATRYGSGFYGPRA